MALKGLKNLGCGEHLGISILVLEGLITSESTG
jgi:hypothetical protein